MKFSTTAFAGMALANSAAAHYFFDVLVIDGQETDSLQYVRENTRTAKYNPTKWKNIRDDMTPDLTDFRCNKGAFEMRKIHYSDLIISAVVGYDTIIWIASKDFPCDVPSSPPGDFLQRVNVYEHKK